MMGSEERSSPPLMEAAVERRQRRVPAVAAGGDPRERGRRNPLEVTCWRRCRRLAAGILSIGLVLPSI
jgi:hypothetical protein